ncbi:flagellar operon protein [Bacillus ectoiniformans]|uniref:TIGR02530 family flagellar biosynthesis protein n=1 Tax=Bacillus ectoiniformans TaxID=1494429 RepID=UPI00195DBF56|nr:TIGR02530 family flagellar biosynthesis protein [Bacillus ectoiniformans]MBM7647126.1 flagellar operon protein [Bacillus ectoiniformans]
MNKTYFPPLHAKTHSAAKANGRIQQPATSFTKHLVEATERKSLIISKHASQRLHERGILIEEQKWQTIEQKMAEAKQKGVSDSLILLQDAALVVSAKNNTVITAMNRSEASSQIFTNINGTIILD